MAPPRALEGDYEAASQILEHAVEETSTPDDVGRLVPLIRDKGRADILQSVGAAKLLVDMIMEEEKMLMTLMLAASGQFPERKVCALEALVELARHPEHNGSVAGSGILGLVCALALCDKDQPRTRALAFDCIRVLGVNPFPAALDPQREREYANLR
eukprot:CAMPEP_0118949828 /NCGR_PEP_ID=MMETSP1169-20130426/50313_1 /TAXON_ID=36882 /ORGANISM="Pyramimonas obovata, Strain CCMP722" /LENGTH=156 /DNA_ID=CAMNT_0006896537 /DNA_START=399 /DNA_END=865 /DNA_ORIENTATION=+